MAHAAFNAAVKNFTLYHCLQRRRRVMYAFFLNALKHSFDALWLLSQRKRRAIRMLSSA
jgi:hypothetical protein